MNIRLATMAVLTAVSALSATAAQAEETAPPPPNTVSGSVALVSDYRYRGVSQSNGGAAVQGGITVSHESGAYAGFWGSNLAGWGTFGGPNLELDLIAGYKFPVAKSATLDVDPDVTGFGEFQRIAHQVDQHLAQPQRVAVDPFRHIDGEQVAQFHVALLRRRPHPGRLRGVVMVTVLTAVALLAV